jgi:hypothetical protein
MKGNQGFEADAPASYVKLERAARLVGTSIAPERGTADAVPGLQLLENFDQHWAEVAGRRIDCNYGVSEIPVEALARYDDVTDQIVIIVSPATYHGLRNELPRARFCLCHEIGHVALHTEQLVRMASIPHRTAALMRGEWSKHPPFRDTEWQANSFAAAILMPARGLEEMRADGSLTVASVQLRYRVSAEAARIRINTFSKRRGELLAA